MPISTRCGHGLECRYNARVHCGRLAGITPILDVPLTLAMGPDKGKAGAGILSNVPGKPGDNAETCGPPEWGTPRFRNSEMIAADSLALVTRNRWPSSMVTQPRIRNEARQDAAVDDRHDRIVGSRHDQRRLRKQPQPGQAASSRQPAMQLQVIAVVARPADMAQVLAHELGRAAQRPAIDVAGDALSCSRDPCSAAASPS